MSISRERTHGRKSERPENRKINNHQTEQKAAEEANGAREIWACRLTVIWLLLYSLVLRSTTHHGGALVMPNVLNQCRCSDI